MTQAGTVSRRKVLRDGAVVAALSAVPLSIAQVAGATTRPSARHRGSLRHVPLTRSTFEPLVGRTFTTSGQGDTRHAVLAEVNDLVPAKTSGDEHRFALVFHAARGGKPESGVKRFHHPELGSVSLFAGPVDRGVKAARYEAIINR
jgi:hypothetical protein